MHRPIGIEMREYDRKKAIDAIGAGDLFFSGHDVIIHEHPVLDMSAFDDDLSGQDGHR